MSQTLTQMQQNTSDTDGKPLKVAQNQHLLKKLRQRKHNIKQRKSLTQVKVLTEIGSLHFPTITTHHFLFD